jgi:hypothetical protein
MCDVIVDGLYVDNQAQNLLNVKNRFEAYKILDSGKLNAT